MELKTLESFGPIDPNIVILNLDEYAFISGSYIIVKQFRTSGERNYKFLKSEASHFSAMDFNPSQNVLATCESGRNAIIRLYSYVRPSGFDSTTPTSPTPSVKPLSETSISKALEVQSLSLSRECNRLVALLSEPLLQLKVYDINDQMQLTLILSVELDRAYSFCKISPVNKNFIFLKHKHYCSMVEIKDSFKDSYQTQISEDRDINLVKVTEEMEIDKRFVLYHLKIQFFVDDFIDFTFDTYNNIYVALSSGEVHLYDSYLNKVMANVNGEIKDCIKLNRPATCICLTQRFLLCLLENGKIACVNIFIPEKDLNAFKPSIGLAESYRIFKTEKELTPTIYADNNYDEKIEDVYVMRYDPEMKKILILTKNNMSLILSKAEILVKDKEKELESDDQKTALNNEVESYEEVKFHSGKIIGVKELGMTSQFVSIGEDRKLIIWELSSRSTSIAHNLNFTPTSFETDIEGNLIFIGSENGVIRIYDISSRNVMKLLNINKYFPANKKNNSIKINTRIDKIIVHPTMKFIAFYTKDDNYIYFISGNISKNFQFLGYINTPANILDIALNRDPENGEVVVLIRNFLLLYKITSFIIDHKIAIEIKQKKTTNLYSNFELKCDIKARKVDGDLNLIIKNPSLETLWLSGSEKYLRLYNLPQDSIEIAKKNSKSPTENPLRDYKGHDLEVTCGVVNGSVLITAGIDGSIQIRREEKEKVEKKIRCHSYIKDGITSLYFSPMRNLIYAGGVDGSIFIIGEDELSKIPTEQITNILNNEILEGMEAIDPQEDEFVKSFEEIMQDEHNNLIHKSKKTSQQVFKAKIDEIRAEVNKLINENVKLEEIEKLTKEEMIIDHERIAKETKDGVRTSHEKTKEYFRELCEKELKRSILFEKTYDNMRVKEGGHGHNSEKIINNNIRMVSSSGGDKILKTYPIRKINETEIKRINYVKQMRLMELNDKYKRRTEKTKEVIDPTLFSTEEENYIINRVPVKINLIEAEIRQQDVADTNTVDGNEKMAEGGQYKASKYKLQRHPYADEGNGYGNAKQEENSYQVSYKPDEQLLREDLVVKFSTVVEMSKGIPDIEFLRNLNEIEANSLLYSPFELYSNFRMRNQIYLILDIIQSLKFNFNKDFKNFITERNAQLEKFNANKLAIDVIKEVLLSLNSDVVIEDYVYGINQHEDNEWVEKIDETEIRVPRYFSREEKMRKDLEQKLEEDRIRALQGDTMEMRGLNNMIELKSLKSKQNQSEELELVKEQWMDKEKKDMTDEEIRKYTDYARKEKDILERKEKIRSQNMTKLNSHKMEIDTIKTDLDSKFLKILKKKLYYDYRVTEQEMNILALIKTMEYRDEIKQLQNEIKSEGGKHTADEIKQKEKVNEFVENIKKFEEAYHAFLIGYNERNKNNKLIEAEKNLFDTIDTGNEKDDVLQKYRSDPFYFNEKDKSRHVRKYGTKNYKEISSMFMRNVGNVNQRNTQEENVNFMNQKYYFDYKNDQMMSHKNFLEMEADKILELKTESENNLKKYTEDVNKSKLNIDILIRLKKGQDEITSNNGPQEFIDQALLIDHMEIEDLNRRINNIYTTLQSNSNTEKDHNEIFQFLDLENIKTELTKHEIELKLRYLKLTRVTKKVQEIVTGREDVDQQQIALVYEQKKRNLDENKTKRIQTMNDKLKDLNNDIEKKKKENSEFIEKSQKLIQEVKLKEQIIELDDEDETQNKNSQSSKSKTKSLEIAQVTKLKNLVQQYYEEIEYLRSELDRLRARTFPSFLQKPDQIIYPDEK